jgi:signal transduction histidine kinase
MDLLIGAVFIALGLVSAARARAVAVLMVLVGVTWLAGDVNGQAALLHRGPLVQLLVTYPDGRLTSRAQWLAVIAAYVSAVVVDVGAEPAVTLAIGAALAGVALWRYLASAGALRRAHAVPAAAGLAIGAVLAFGGAARLAGADLDHAVLIAYELVLLATAAALAVDVRSGGWADATMRELVIDLGEPDEVGAMAGKLARAVGDPSLTVAYRLEYDDAYVDEHGRPVQRPAADAQRAVTPIRRDGDEIAVLVHDPTVLREPALVEAITAAVGVAVANARLQAEVRQHVADVAASRRRVQVAADLRRRRFGTELRIRVDVPLLRAVQLVDDPLLAHELSGVRADVGRFAEGLHPAGLDVAGLASALARHADLSPFPVTVDVEPGRLPAAVERTAFFVCSEALANIAKHAMASRAAVRVSRVGDDVRVEVTDDGRGGADPGRGSGLRGLGDRVEALGGTLEVGAAPAGGTSVVARLPMSA